MQEPRFLGWLKSANTLIFFGVGVLLLGVLGYAAYQIYRDIVRDQVATDVARVTSPDEAVKTQLSLGTFTPIEGTPYYFAPIAAEQNYRQDYYEKAALSVRNYLILNVNDRSTVRLISKNDALFVGIEKFGQKNDKGELLKVQGLWYQVVEADTNGDKRLTEIDQKTIAVSDVTGKNYTELIPRVDRLLGTFPKSPTNLMLVYETSQKNFVTEINVVTRQVIATQELPAIE